MNFDAFSHGQIQSKLWLLDHLEPIMDFRERVAILGSWYNVLGFMMIVRKDIYYKEIIGFDVDYTVKPIADKLNNAFTFGYPYVHNKTANANELDLDNFTTIINCSPEHFENDDWFHKIPKNTLVCIQSSDVTDPDPPWLITNPNPTLEHFRSKYPLSTIYFCDTLRIQYSESGYNRFMIIGLK